MRANAFEGLAEKLNSLCTSSPRSFSEGQKGSERSSATENRGQRSVWIQVLVVPKT